MGEGGYRGCTHVREGVGVIMGVRYRGGGRGGRGRFTSIEKFGGGRHRSHKQARQHHHQLQVGPTHHLRTEQWQYLPKVAKTCEQRRKKPATSYQVRITSQ